MISIVTVTKNNLEGLKKTYYSISTQTDKPDEWIVIDGFSDDGTEEFINQLELDFPINFIKQIPNGVYDAIQFGLSIANETWVQFLNAGDIFSESISLKIIKEEIKKHKNKILLFGYFKGDFKINPSTPKTAKLGTCHQAIIYPIQILKKYPFDNKLKIFADNFQMTQMLNDGIQFILVNYPVIIFEPGGISEKLYKKGLIEMRFTWYYKYGSFFGFLAWLIWIIKLIAISLGNKFFAKRLMCVIFISKHIVTFINLSKI